MPSLTKGGHEGLQASDASTLLGLTQGYRWSAFSLKQQDPELQELIQPLEKDWSEPAETESPAQEPLEYVG